MQAGAPIDRSLQCPHLRIREGSNCIFAPGSKYSPIYSLSPPSNAHPVEACHHSAPSAVLHAPRSDLAGPDRDRQLHSTERKGCTFKLLGAAFMRNNTKPSLSPLVLVAAPSRLHWRNRRSSLFAQCAMFEAASASGIPLFEGRETGRRTNIGIDIAVAFKQQHFIISRT